MESVGQLIRKEHKAFQSVTYKQIGKSLSGSHNERLWNGGGTYLKHFLTMLSLKSQAGQYRPPGNARYSATNSDFQGSQAVEASWTLTSALRSVTMDLALTCALQPNILSRPCKRGGFSFRFCETGEATPADMGI